MAPPKPTTLGRYQLLAKLATGGMAEIYLARQTGIRGFERLVVIKRILPHLAGEERFVEMFFDEARIAAQLNHPNIVQIYDLGQEGQDYYIAMEYLEGESLGYLVSEGAKGGHKLSPALAAAIVAQVCDGLDYAHKLRDEIGRPLQIVHRDVSPHNIIVLFSGAVKLVDFGIAKAASQMHNTRVGTLKGKLTYMPPEQSLGKPVDARSDIFSLGIVLWELLTHRRLFKRDNEAEVITAIVTQDAPSIREIQPEVPEIFEAVALQALQREPAQRFQSAGEMSAALREGLRQSGFQPSSADIGAFVQGVFAERARTKQHLLDEIRQKGSNEISLGLLKPETDESLPSRSQLRSVSEKESLQNAQTRILEEGEKPAPPPPPVHPRKRPTWILAIGLLVIAGALAGWLLMSPLPTTTVRQPPVAPAQPAPLPPAQPLLSPEPAPPDAGQPGAAEPAPTPEPMAFDGGVSPPDAAVELNPRKLAIVRPTAPKAVNGTLRLDSIPWSEVYLGKNKLGMTPLLDQKLPAGSYSLLLVNEGRGLKKTISVTIQPGKVTTLKIKLAE